MKPRFQVARLQNVGRDLEGDKQNKDDFRFPSPAGDFMRSTSFVFRHPSTRQTNPLIEGKISLVDSKSFGRSSSAFIFAYTALPTPDARQNKTRHVTTTSRSLEMIFRNYNLNPVSDDRRRW